MDDLATRQFVELERIHWWFEGRRRIFFDVLERLLPGRSNLRMLDVGCGVGGMMVELRRFGDPSGLELSTEMVARARERGFSKSFCGNAESLPVGSGRLDLVTAFDCIEHLDRDDQALSEFHRVLRPGGRLFVSVPAYQFLYAENDRVAQHKRRYRRNLLVQRIHDAGFEVEKASHINLLLFPAILPAVLLLKLKQRLLKTSFKNGSTETNLSYTPPAWLNRSLANLFGSERYLLRHLSFPVGHSIFAAARKPDR
jgi:SAM-dependent methyltransferase